MSAFVIAWSTATCTSVSPAAGATAVAMPRDTARISSASGGEWSGPSIGSLTGGPPKSRPCPQTIFSGLMGAFEGKVAIVTGGGRGIGRAEAHRLAAEGARVVVNDFGGSLVGEGGDRLPAEVVVEEIRASGGDAIADTGDITEWDTGRRLVAAALDHFGRLDVLVNNAGIARPRMSFNMSEDDWDLVTRIHLTGAFTATRFAAEHWRDEAKRGATAVDAAVVFTTSINGLQGVPGHVNYAAAKAGVAAMTTVLAAELAPYGVRCNAIAPLAVHPHDRRAARHAHVRRRPS